VLGCNLAIIRVSTVHLRRTTRTTYVRARVYMYMCGTRLRAYVCMCASHDGCVLRASRRASSWPLWSVATRPVSNRFHQDRTSHRIRRTLIPRDLDKRELSCPFCFERRCGQHESIREYETKKVNGSASLNNSYLILFLMKRHFPGRSLRNINMRNISAFMRNVTLYFALFSHQRCKEWRFVEEIILHVNKKSCMCKYFLDQ